MLWECVPILLSRFTFLGLALCFGPEVYCPLTGEIRRRPYVYKNYLNAYIETYQVYITPRQKRSCFELKFSNEVNGLNI